MLKHVFIVFFLGNLFSYTSISGYKAVVKYEDKKNKNSAEEKELGVYTINDSSGPFLPEYFRGHKIIIKNYPSNSIRVRGNIEINIDGRSMLCAPPQKSYPTKITVDKLTKIIISNDQD